jgi:zinc transporter ZupT
MIDIAHAFAVAVAITNAVAGLVAAALWWRVEPRPYAWILIRVGQAAAVGQAIAAGVLAAGGLQPQDDLYWLYALLPVAVGFVAEQLRLVSAQMVLDQRDLDDAQAVGRLPEDQQRSVVLQIVRRELGVMAAAALVSAFLALRALGTV